MTPRQSLRLNKRQSAAYRRVHSVLANPPQATRFARLWAVLAGR